MGTDQRSDQATNRQMDKAGCRVACTRLKTSHPRIAHGQRYPMPERPGLGPEKADLALGPESLRGAWGGGWMYVRTDV